MSLLGFLKQKKKQDLELPPPPQIEAFASLSEIPDIRVGELPTPPMPSVSAPAMDVALPPPPMPKKVGKKFTDKKAPEIFEEKPEMSVPPGLEFPEMQSGEDAAAESEEEVPMPTTQIEFPVADEVPRPPSKKEEEPVVFDKTISMSAMHMEENAPQVVRRSQQPHKTFVSLDDYAKITASADLIRDRMSEAESLMRRLHALNNDETKAREKWLGHLEGVEKKLSQVDKLLAKAQV